MIFYVFLCLRPDFSFWQLDFRFSVPDFQKELVVLSDNPFSFFKILEQLAKLIKILRDYVLMLGFSLVDLILQGGLPR